MVIFQFANVKLPSGGVRRAPKWCELASSCSLRLDPPGTVPLILVGMNRLFGNQKNAEIKWQNYGDMMIDGGG